MRLLRGDFDAVTEYSSDPVAMARVFAEFQVSTLHVVDLDGARSGLQPNRQLVAAIAAESQLTVQVGGGIRTGQDVSAWLATGVARCVVGSTAIETPQRVAGWLEKFGSSRIVLALDVRPDTQGEPILMSRGWTVDSGRSLWELLDLFPVPEELRVLVTDVERDGALTGPNVDLYHKILQRYPGIQLQASGGIRHVGDLEALRELGCPAAISGRALLDGNIRPEEIASFRQSA